MTGRKKITDLFLKGLQRFRIIGLIIILIPRLIIAQPEVNTDTQDSAEQQGSQKKGLEIAVEADRRDSGFGDFTAELVMLLKNSHGEKSTRYMRNRVLESVNDVDKSMLIFDRPRDIKGTALLTYSYRKRTDDQWIYLPALKRVKRISSNNKSGPFMGSEFAFEDLVSDHIEKYTYRFLRSEKIDGTDCLVVERCPVDNKSGYLYQTVYYDRQEYRIYKIDYYDRKKDLLKTLTFQNYKRYNDKYWRAGKMIMVNHQTGKSTESSWINYKFKTGLTERDFDMNSLKLAR